MSKEIFLNNIRKNLNLTETENGAITNKSSLNALLDFFGQAPAMRRGSEADIIRLFECAFTEDKERALKCVFYIGDILQGAGERRCFRILLKHIATNYPKELSENMFYIPSFNRWDSLYELFDTPLEEEVIKLMKMRLLLDLKVENPSLIGKWLKSPNASSTETKMLGKKTARLMNLGEFSNPNSPEAKKANEKYYRKALSSLRAKLNVVEKNMSAKDWSKINYEAVPSVAMNNYQDAFYKNDRFGFEDYCVKIEKGEAKINSKALFPHQISSKVLNGKIKNRLDRAITNAQWSSLPDFINGSDMKGICVCDVSGSMHGEPMEAAVALGLYISERCTGVYKDKFITFSESPELVTIKGDNIVDRANSVHRADWGYNTNLEKVFDLILDTAVKNNAPQEDMPNCLFILTDMEFDSLQSNSYYDWSIGRRRTNSFAKDTFIETMKMRYQRAGYEMPILVCWNLRASGSNMPMTADINGWISVAGFSPSIMKALLSAELLGKEEEIPRESINPVDAMLVVLDSERYSNIKAYGDTNE